MTKLLKHILLYLAGAISMIIIICVFRVHVCAVLLYLIFRS
jgi:hypothetical protein